MTYRTGNITDNEETLTEIRAWAVTNLLRLKAVFGPLLKQYKNKAKELYPS